MEAELRGSQKDLMAMANPVPRRFVQRKMTTSYCTTEVEQQSTTSFSNPEK